MIFYEQLAIERLERAAAEWRNPNGLKPVFHKADFSARSGAAIVIALFISNNGHFWSLRYARI